MKRFVTVLCLLLLPLFLFFNGCIDQHASLSNTYAYHDVILNLNYSGSNRIAVAVHDQRTLVVSGKKSPIYAGSVMSIVRQKSDVTTESGRQLAADMVGSICMSLKYNGFRTIPVFVAHSDRPGQVMKKLLKTKASRYVLVTLSTWESNTYKNTTLNFDLRLDVYNRDSKLLARKESSGEVDIAGKLSGPHTSAKIFVPDMFRRQLEFVFNDFKIAEALE